MKPANDYAWSQCWRALQARGAKVRTDGLAMLAEFDDPASADTAARALGSKYPATGPNAVWMIRTTPTLLQFQFRSKGQGSTCR